MGKTWMYREMTEARMIVTAVTHMIGDMNCELDTLLIRQTLLGSKVVYTWRASVLSADWAELFH